MSRLDEPVLMAVPKPMQIESENLTFIIDWRVVTMLEKRMFSELFLYVEFSWQLCVHDKSGLVLFQESHA